jgi:hypothetical protein
MISFHANIIGGQVTQAQDLQRLLGVRIQKLTELVAIEREISQVCAAYLPVAATFNLLPNPSTIVREEEEDENQEEQPASTIADSATATGKKGRPQKAEGFSQEKSLPTLIINFLKGKKSGESLSAIVGFCLNSGYESSSDNFKRVVEQTLYSMKVKKMIIKDDVTRRFFLC